MVKRLITAGTVAIAALVIILLLRQSSRPVDIVGEFSELRETKTESEVILQDYHRTTEVLDSLVNLGEYHQALGIVEKALEKKTRFHVNYLFEKGKILFFQGEYVEAKTAFDATFNFSNGSHLKSRLWKAFSLAKLHECDSAIIQAEWVLERNSMFRSDYERVKEECSDIL